ncbi:unnamed protein product [Arabidopsis lyrata]|uniref:Predicted protein n=1 Tax=Arabidopsis lyrata subsp. lyrata TaxID=81972 RepID=D7M832_ARALL|nr:predicted protein [Arabidopsis lyrata subsp. lyrata]CAH8271267.1 unnamed protein product [Arabidopsis lyrata]
MSRKRCMRMESLLPHHVVERILESLEVNSLLRFKAVSKQWKSTIESQFFQGKHLTHRLQSGDSDVLMVAVHNDDPLHVETLKTLVLGSSSSVKIPTPWEENDKDRYYFVSYNSCDGLVCLYQPKEPGFVVNPTTRWLGFGKDIFTATYKPVWLYTSTEIGIEETATTCEMGRFIGSPRPSAKKPKLYLSIFTPKLISKAPFVNSDPYEIVMCNLDNRLCVSEMKWPTQVIWSFLVQFRQQDMGQNHSIDMVINVDRRNNLRFVVVPLASLKKKKLLCHDRVLCPKLFTHDPETKEDDVAFSAANSIGLPVCYFPSLISIL